MSDVVKSWAVFFFFFNLNDDGSLKSAGIFFFSMILLKFELNVW